MAHARKDLKSIESTARETGDKAEQALAKVGRQARKSGTEAKEAGDDTGKSWDQAGEEVEDAGEKISETGRKTKRTGEETEELGSRAAKAGGLLGKLGPVGAAAMAALAVGIGGAAVAVDQLQAALAAAMDRGRTAAQEGAAIGMDPGQIRALGQRAGELYAAGFGESADEATAGITAVTMSIEGMRIKSAADIDAVAARALTFANVFKVDVADAAKFAGTLLSVGLARDANHAFDLITRASQKVPPALRGDIMDAGEEYGHFFQSLGFDGEQAFGILVEASAKSKYGIDKAGDAIKEFTLLATEMKASTVEAYEAIGLDAEDMARDLLAGGETAQAAFRMIVEGILDIEDPLERAQTAVDLFGTPIEDLNKNDIPEFLRNLVAASDGLEGVAGSTDRAGEALKAYPLSTLDRLRRGWETLQANVGDRLAPAVDRALGAFERIAGSDDVQAFLGDVDAIIRKVADDALPGLEQQWDSAVQAFRDNQEEIELVGKLLAWAFSEAVIDNVRRLFLALEVGARATGVVVRGFEDMGNRVMAILGHLVSSAAHAFGWMPGIGPKLRQAEKDFDAFQRRVNNALAAIKNRNVNVNVGVTGAGARFVTGDASLGTSVQFGGGFREYATGGITSGRLISVGERGRELLEVPAGSKVHPNGATEAIMAGNSGGRPVPQVWQLPAPAEGLERLFLSWLQGALRDNPGVVLRTAS
jgi:hypothetical protein